MQEFDLLKELKDIKGISEIDLSFLYPWIFLILILILIAIFCLFKIIFMPRYKKIRKISKKELAFNELKSIDFKNEKESIYQFSQNFPYFLDENNKDKFNEINKKLEIYKYKKDTPTLDKILKNEILNLIKSLKPKDIKWLSLKIYGLF